MHRAVIELAVAAGIHINHQTLKNMRLELSAMLAVIAAASRAITRAKQATTAAVAALEPLKRENIQFKLQLEQLETADEQLDEALTELRDSIPAEEPTNDPAQLELSLDGPGPDEKGPQGAEGTASEPLTTPEGVQTDEQSPSGSPLTPAAEGTVPA